MADRYAGQKIRFNWVGLTGMAAGNRLLAENVSSASAIAGAEPLADGTFT